MDAVLMGSDAGVVNRRPQKLERDSLLIIERSFDSGSVVACEKLFKSRELVQRLLVTLPTYEVNRLWNLASSVDLSVPMTKEVMLDRVYMAICKGAEMQSCNQECLVQAIEDAGTCVGFLMTQSGQR